MDLTQAYNHLAIHSTVSDYQVLSAFRARLYENTTERTDLKTAILVIARARQRIRFMEDVLDTITYEDHLAMINPPRAHSSTEGALWSSLAPGSNASSSYSDHQTGAISNDDGDHDDDDDDDYDDGDDNGEVGALLSFPAAPAYTPRELTPSAFASLCQICDRRMTPNCPAGHVFTRCRTCGWELIHGRCSYCVSNADPPTTHPNPSTMTTNSSSSSSSSTSSSSVSPLTSTPAAAAAAGIGGEQPGRRRRRGVGGGPKTEAEIEAGVFWDPDDGVWRCEGCVWEVLGWGNEGRGLCRCGRVDLMVGVEGWGVGGWEEEEEEEGEVGGVEVGGVEVGGVEVGGGEVEEEQKGEEEEGEVEEEQKGEEEKEGEGEVGGVEVGGVEVEGGEVGEEQKG
ncbi:hypothetical protein MMC12_007659, partial [Toensbergia leucococca]|nr:hypothetical protein [Toensbergia leucococca]